MSSDNLVILTWIIAVVVGGAGIAITFEAVCTLAENLRDKKHRARLNEKRAHTHEQAIKIHTRTHTPESAYKPLGKMYPHTAQKRNRRT